MDVIIGLGETGLPWFNLVSKVRKVIGIDIKPDKCKGLWRGESVEILHICIPYSDNFVDTVVDYALNYKPKALVVHSTVQPFTTRKIDQDDGLPRNLRVLYSPVRGVHARMEIDLGKYDKFYASYQSDCTLFKNLLSDMAIGSCRAKNPHTLEFAKVLCDTTYYAYLIVYAMKTEETAMKYDIDYDEMWMFASQIDKYLGNRPPCGAPGLSKLYPEPKGIGGHCLLPNLELVKDDIGEVYTLIHMINNSCIERHKNVD